MFAVKHPQHVRYRALHAERQPVDTLGSQLSEFSGADGFRVRLDGNLGAVREAEALVDFLHNPAEPPRGEQRGRAAAEEHRAHRRARRGKDLRRKVDFPGQHVGIGGLASAAAEFRSSVGIEIAVAAAGSAERYVYVNPKRGIPKTLGRFEWQGSVVGNRFTLRQRSWHRAEDKL